jgi:excisionase family DNA binding protein
MSDYEYLYKVSELARYLRVSRMSIYRMIEDGRLRSINIGGKTVRIPESAVAELTGGYTPPRIVTTVDERDRDRQE